jgi:hypothetical protein
MLCLASAFAGTRTARVSAAAARMTIFRMRTPLPVPSSWRHELTALDADSHVPFSQ